MSSTNAVLVYKMGITWVLRGVKFLSLLLLPSVAPYLLKGGGQCAHPQPPLWQLTHGDTHIAFGSLTFSRAWVTAKRDENVAFLSEQHVSPRVG